MGQLEKEFGWLELWFRSKFDTLAGYIQSLCDWVINNQGIIIPSFALLFLVTILYIAARNVIMPKDKEGSG